MGCEESYLPKTENMINNLNIQTHAIQRRKNNAIRYQTKSYEIKNEGKFQLTDEDLDMIQHSLLNHQLLFKAKGYASMQIINKLEKFSIKQNQIIFEKGDISDYFYFILKGKVGISQLARGIQQKILQRGDCFGDLAIYNKSMRSAKATALTDCNLLALKKQSFLRISLEINKKSHNSIFKEIKNIRVFQHLNWHQKHKISYLAQELKYQKGKFIFRRGENSDCLYVVKKGKICLKIPDKQDIEIMPKQSFGQGCLHQQNSIRYADAICLQNSILLAFSKADVLKYLGNSLIEVEITNKVIWALKHQKQLKMSQLIMDAMLEIREISFYHDGQVIQKKGSPIKYLVISLEGGINDGKELQVMNTCYLVNMKYAIQDLIKNRDGIVALIDIDKIQNKFNRALESLVNLENSLCKEIQSYQKIQEYTKTLKLHTFSIIKSIGEGLYGPTLIVKAESNIQFALRLIEKSKILKFGTQRQVSMLKKVNNKITHNLIAKTYRLYSDDSRLYFLNRLVKGQDLFDLLNKSEKVSMPIAKHFMACIISILEYLHGRKILWKEMKIESFVIDQSGYLNLVDLMYLQELGQDQAYLSSPNKATIYYVSPETLLGQGYGFQSDFWSLGIIFYKLMLGQFPYGQKLGKCDEKYLYNFLDEIQNKDLYLPNWLPLQAKILIKLLLNPNPIERSLISISKLKGMSLFKDYSWLNLMQKKVQNVPYIPKKQNYSSKQTINMERWLAYQGIERPPESQLDQLNII